LHKYRLHWISLCPLGVQYIDDLQLS
jgi:hypothetical protein